MPKAGTNIKTILIGKPEKDGTVTFTFGYKSDAAGSRTIKIEAKADISKDDTAVEKATKIVAAINAKIREQIAANRGALASQSSIRIDAETTVLLPVVNLTNLGGFGLAKKSKYDSGKTKEKKTVVNLAYREIDKKPDYALASYKETGTRPIIGFDGDPSEGQIVMALDGAATVSVETAGKSLAALHEEMAARFSEIGIDVTIKDTRTVLFDEEPGDGHEIHFNDLESTGYSIWSTDPGLTYVAMIDGEAF